MSGEVTPAYRVTGSLINETDWPLTLTGFGKQTGGDWEVYVPQVIDGKSTGTWTETAEYLTDKTEGYVEYSLCDGEDIYEVRVYWLSPHPTGEWKAAFRGEVTGGESQNYEVKATYDDKNHTAVEYTLVKL
ncbi:hypothetical protein ABW19_dt0206735 [Dactylella cylindrospora]|nr:hypothetical protein ABW19_dt0206735 [Dactylella cylindrospora]